MDGDNEDDVNKSYSSCGIKYVCCLCLKCICILNRHIQSNVLLRWKVANVNIHLHLLLYKVFGWMSIKM